MTDATGLPDPAVPVPLLFIDLQAAPSGANAVAVANNGADGDAYFWSTAGGDPSQTASWTGPTMFAQGSDTRLAAGPSGTFAMALAGKVVPRQLQLRKWTGSGFGAPVNVGPPENGAFPDLVSTRASSRYAVRRGHAARAHAVAGRVQDEGRQRGGQEEAQDAPPLGRRKGRVPHDRQVQLGDRARHEVVRAGQLRRHPHARHARHRHRPRQRQAQDGQGERRQELPRQAQALAVAHRRRALLGAPLSITCDAHVLVWGTCRR